MADTPIQPGTEEDVNAAPSPDASDNLDTSFGVEDDDQTGAEHDGPVKAPDSQGGAYVIP